MRKQRAFNWFWTVSLRKWLLNQRLKMIRKLEGKSGRVVEEDSRQKESTGESQVWGKAFKELKEVHCDWSRMSKWKNSMVLIVFSLKTYIKFHQSLETLPFLFIIRTY